jgi:hypothetical protein
MDIGCKSYYWVLLIGIQPLLVLLVEKWQKGILGRT